MKLDRTHVYCPNCETIRPVKVIDMDGCDVSGQFEAPTDVCCDCCHYIVATFYRDPAPA